MKTLFLLTLVLASLPALAQDARATRERDALRRAQATLQQTQAQRDALQTEKAALEKDKVAAGSAAETLKRQLATALAEGGRLRDELARRSSEHEAERSRDGAARQQTEAAAVERETALRQQLAEARRERDERSAANQAVVAELARRTQALDEAQKRVRALHALGLEAVERYRDKGLVEQQLQRDPIFGLTAVRIDNIAEDLRTRLDAQRLPAP